MLEKSVSLLFLSHKTTIMRKYGLLAIILFSTIIVSAQKKSYTSGIKVGANFYDLEMDPEPHGSTSMQYFGHAGVSYNIPIAKMFSIQPELLYSGEGVRRKDTTFTSSVRLQYVQIPLMLQLNFSGFYVEAGPQFGILAQAKSSDKNTGISQKQNLKEEVKQTAFSVGGGLGYRTEMIGFGVRYLKGISNLLKEGQPGEWKSTGWQISLSYLIKQ
jgi:hypothetical protein